jgi:hypothetical protein
MREILLRSNMIVVLWLLAAGGAGARSLSIEVERVDAGLLQAERVVLALSWADDAEHGALELRVAGLQFDTLGYRLRDLHWRCPLHRQGPSVWSCEGDADARGMRRGRLHLQIDESRREIALARGQSRLQLAQAAGEAGLAIDARALPVAWLQPLLATVWAEAGLTAGALDANLRLQWSDDETRLDGRVAARALGLDTPDGRIASEELGAAGPLSMRWQGETLAVETELTLRGGQLLVDPWYAELPASEVALALRALREADGRWLLGRLDWRDPGVLQLQASAELLTEADDWLRQLTLEADVADLALAQARYFDALLGAFGGDGLALSGGLRASVDWRLADGWRIEAELAGMSLADASQRFELDRADGRVAWSQRAEALQSRFGWRAAALYGIALGPAELALTSADAGLRLAEPVRIDALGGAIALRRVAWWPARGEATPQFDLGLELIDLDLAALSRRFDWPEFSGRLGGVIPAAHYEHGVLRFDGGLEIALFDGRVEVDALRLERPFGVAPRLQAEIGIEGLDLQPLTSVFGFGEITGRLRGRIDGLQLLDWRPVAFAAEFRTTGAPPRRISQRAVSDLTSIGGGGIAGGVQASMLRMFDSFAYAEIGLSCRLAQGVCEMGGLDSSDGGYTIVQGAGLPRITVRGFQRRVDWAVLVSRLQAVSRGQALRLD